MCSSFGTCQTPSSSSTKGFESHINLQWKNSKLPCMVVLELMVSSIVVIFLHLEKNTSL